MSCNNQYFLIDKTVIRVTTPAKEDADTYRVIIKTNAPTATQINIDIGDNPKYMPTAVNTPFPPLKRPNTVQT